MSWLKAGIFTGLKVVEGFGLVFVPYWLGKLYIYTGFADWMGWHYKDTYASTYGSGLMVTAMSVFTLVFCIGVICIIASWVKANIKLADKIYNKIMRKYE